MNPPILIELLGGLRIRSAKNSTVEFPRQQTGALLALLALYPHRSHTREELMALIWPDDEEESARHKLRQSLYALRRRIDSDPDSDGSAIIATRATVALNPNRIVTDVALFEDSVRNAASVSELDTRIAHLTEAVSLYKGELLPGFYQDEFVLERGLLAESFRSVLRDLTGALEQAGDLKNAIEVGRRTVALDPLIEEAHCHLMRLYAATGEPSAVLRQYEDLSQVLKEQLNETPSPETREMMESLRSRAKEKVAADGSRPMPSAMPEPLNLSELMDKSPVRETRRLNPLHSWAVLSLVLACCAAVGWQAITLRSGPKSRKSARAAFPTPRPGNKFVDGNGLHRREIWPSSAIWTYRYPPKDGDKGSEAQAVITDAERNVYVTGFVETENNDVDYLTVKIAPDGHMLWHKRHNGLLDDVDRSRAIALDSDGNVYVTGDSANGKWDDNKSSKAALDITTIKYSPDGQKSWQHSYDGPDKGEDVPIQIMVDESGAFVLGKSWSTGKRGKAGIDYVLVKYDQNLKKKWDYRYDNGDGDDVPSAMALDRDGRVIITGSSQKSYTSGLESDMLTLKVSAETGEKLWEDRFGAGNRVNDDSRAVCVDAGGNVTIAGMGLGAPGTPAYRKMGCVTVHYPLHGQRIVRATQSERDGLDELYAVRAGSGNSVMALGKANVGSDSVYRLINRDRNGLVQWTRDIGFHIGDGGMTRFSSLAYHVVAGELKYGDKWDIMPAFIQLDHEGLTLREEWLTPEGLTGVVRAITMDNNLKVITGQIYDRDQRKLMVNAYNRQVNP